MKKITLITIALMTSFALTANARIVSQETKKMSGDASRVAYALSSCPAEFAGLMKNANYVGEIKVERIHQEHTNDRYETITEVITIESGIGGVFRPAQKVAELKLTATVFDSRLACDSINCHSYSCKLKRF